MKGAMGRGCTSCQTPAKEERPKRAGVERPDALKPRGHRALPAGRLRCSALCMQCTEPVIQQERRSS